MIHILCGDVRPAFGPLAQRLFSSSSSTWTSTVSLLVIATSSGGISSIGDLGICGVALLGMWSGWLMASLCKDNAGPHKSSAPITVAVESYHGSSYASPSNPLYDCLPVLQMPPTVWLCFFLWVSPSGSVFTLLPLELSVSGLWLGVRHFVLL